MEGIIKHLIFVILVISCLQPVYAQTDTLMLSSNDFIIKRKIDSCTSIRPIAVSAVNYWQGLGEPEFLCDRRYFKEGKLFDEKKSFPFGYIYLQYDSTGNIRHQELSITGAKGKLVVELTNAKKAFWFLNTMKLPSNYFLLEDNQLFQLVNVTWHDSIPPTLKPYLTNSKNQMFKWSISFLRTGMPDEFGHWVWWKGNYRRVGVWVYYQVLERNYNIKIYRLE